jgi:tetratricopeptide (TPR) repeat protein
LLLKLNTDTDLPVTDFFIDSKKAGKVNYQKGTYLQVNLFRDFRVEGKHLVITIDDKNYEAVVQYLPFYKNQTPAQIADELYHLGVDEFQKTNVDLAMEFMKKAIAFNPAHSDAYESIGVILGRKERYEEAIEWMDKLLAVNKSSVLAHTNKSLFLMKLGKIEEAEAEKSLATVKSFSMYGEEAKIKKALAEEKAKKEADLLRREQIFLQVIEMDADDTIALYGLGDIAFFRNQYKEAAQKLSKVISIDEKYSTAYLLLGKSLEAMGDSLKAQEVYQKGIEVASKRGDMMPANEMQSRLNQLVVSSRLL